MAIYHLSAKIVSRATGRSAVGAAAYRSGESLHDERTGQTFDYTYKAGVEHSEILAPSEAPSWVHDREVLWNAVEQVERRKDAQLAREIEIGLPIELNKDRQVALLRDYVGSTFVSRGMVADMALHLDNPDNPHAHVLLTTRQVTPQGFGAKRRDWNVRSELKEWRAEWAGITNQHLARAGLDIRIDHRTLEAQGIDLLPGRKIGLSVERQQQPDLPLGAAERVAEQRKIAAENGRRILEDPQRALHALTRSQTSFTERDIAKYLHGRTAGAEQFQAAYLKVTTSPELVRLGGHDPAELRLTTREIQRAVHPVRPSPPSSYMSEIDAAQQRAAERWRDKQLAREANLSAQVSREQENDLHLDSDSSLQKEIQKRHHELEYPGPEEDFEL